MAAAYLGNHRLKSLAGRLPGVAGRGEGRRVKRSGCITGELKIAHEILAYLVENPDAQDTLEGIIQWWLLEQRIKRQTTNVKEALAELVAQGLIIERQGRDSRTHYRINRRRRGEIRALLNKGGERR
jgi:hypothetical protein